MARPFDRRLGCFDVGRCTAVLELGLRMNEAEVERRDVEAPHLMAALDRAGAVGVGQRVAEPLADRIGVAVEDQDPCSHAREVA